MTLLELHALAIQQGYAGGTHWTPLGYEVYHCPTPCLRCGVPLFMHPDPVHVETWLRANPCSVRYPALRI